ncbi:AraC family transcriptional regulator [Flavihumibacter fluvii]|uniref:AraC family transcriptional regulator n=1 Tax=Flavihumibacter fluvii TaxID=2838157 RepID=UPI001BDE6074|nr:AraC family transcriptional regulator [Flavihumibacter fluvii]ULQ51045.1 AraC family transcriptional regulator [Flavihumibacter fluvii]
MKPYLERLPMASDSSFVARTYRTPHFEVPWHQHPEIELILFLEGEGNAFVGNHIGNFNSGDIYLLGSNLPHTFQKAEQEMVTSAVVVQFLHNCWGDQLLQMPECRAIKALFETANAGLKLQGETVEQLRPLIAQLEHAIGFNRVMLLWQCLGIISAKKEYELLSTQNMANLQTRQQARVDKIFLYTIEHFAEGITLEDIAAHVNMSIPAFCLYFRKHTKKTYIEFLNEVRIGKACQQLIDTQKTISEIAYDCGYNTLANFNKQFLKIRKIQPSQYRKIFSESESLDNSHLPDSGKTYLPITVN